MIEISAAGIVLPDRLTGPGIVVIDGERIVEIHEGAGAPHAGRYVVPGFIDVHVHGVEGADTLDGGDAVQRIARRLPRFGVTAFCPTTVACAPDALRAMLSDVRAARVNRHDNAARVLPAHLESNFINPDFKGAQPLTCLRSPAGGGQRQGDFTGSDILNEIEAARADVGIVTVAPELDGALDLIASLVKHGHHVSLGHSGATYEQALAGIAAGARQATHLFNRMTPFSHRAPGLAGAVLDHPDVTVEIVCDAVHVHPAGVRVAIAAKGQSHVMAITDGTAGSGLPHGSETSLGGRRITVRDVAYLDDGTIAGSVLTMDQAFGTLVKTVGTDLVTAAQLCATTPARALQLHGLGAIAPGAFADLVVLDAELRVVQTYIAGRLVWSEGE
jgi:N-acetylglucosamine-6-phosphate deacetylase